jgi:hypothetical protein
MLFLFCITKIVIKNETSKYFLRFHKKNNYFFQLNNIFSSNPVPALYQTCDSKKQVDLKSHEIGCFPGGSPKLQLFDRQLTKA